MPLPLIVAPIISGITSIFGNWMKTRKVTAEGKIHIQKAKIEAKCRKINNMHIMDANAANDMRYSWKDEFFVILLAAPYIMCFIPSLAPYVQEGFTVLKNSTPEWYQYSFLGAIAATFGLRALLPWMTYGQIRCWLIRKSYTSLYLKMESNL